MTSGDSVVLRFKRRRKLPKSPLICTDNELVNPLMLRESGEGEYSAVVSRTKTKDGKVLPGFTVKGGVSIVVPMTRLTVYVFMTANAIADLNMTMARDESGREIKGGIVSENDLATCCFATDRDKITDVQIEAIRCEMAKLMANRLAIADWVIPNGRSDNPDRWQSSASVDADMTAVRGLMPFFDCEPCQIESEHGGVSRGYVRGAVCGLYRWAKTSGRLRSFSRDLIAAAPLYRTPENLLLELPILERVMSRAVSGRMYIVNRAGTNSDAILDGVALADKPAVKLRAIPRKNVAERKKFQSAMQDYVRRKGRLRRYLEHLEKQHAITVTALIKHGREWVGFEFARVPFNSYEEDT